MDLWLFVTGFSLFAIAITASRATDYIEQIRDALLDNEND